MIEQIVGFCERCTGNVILASRRWSCGCTGIGGVTKWRRSWQAWEPTNTGGNHG